MKFASRILHPAVYICWFLVLVFSACKQAETTRKPPNPHESVKFSVTLSKTEPEIVYFDADRPLNEAFSLTKPGTKALLPYPLQKRPALFVPLDKSSILLLVNKVGFVQLTFTANADVSTTIQFDSPVSVEGVPVNQYSAGSVWQTNNHQYLLLYKDHVLDTDWAATVLFEFSGDTVSRIEIPPHPENKRYEPYWIFPTSENTWLIQYRYIIGDRSYTTYASWDRKHNKLSELTRTSFERQLTPITFEKAPAPIRLIAEHISEPVLLEYRDSNGAIHYINNKNLDDAVLGIAETNNYGTFVLLEDGRYWIARGQVPPSVSSSENQTITPKQQQSAISFSGTPPVTIGQATVPVDDVHFRNAILTDTVFISTWEENGFPETGMSGLFLFQLP
ncbi:MAG TPA: hypothetical protein PLV76_05725 [Spirochaetales bacterium]|nr:hypothetical protein [Spirochaetales bacterium]